MKNLNQVANTLLLSSDNQLVGESGPAILQELNSKLQSSYRGYYDRSGIKRRIEGLLNIQESDEKALQMVSQEAGKGEGGWNATFPNLRTQDQGMDCTLAAAMLNIGLKDLGYDARSTLRSGHYIVSRILEDGGVKIYDPATRVTEDGVTSGYSRIFSVNEVRLTDVDEGNGGKGTRIELIIDEPDLPGGFREPDSLDGKYKQILYASPPTTLLDLSVALDNIDSLKKDADEVPTVGIVQSEAQPDVWRKQAKQVVSNHPEIRQFSHQELKQQLNFFDPYDVIKSQK